MGEGEGMAARYTEWESLLAAARDAAERGMDFMDLAVAAMTRRDTETARVMWESANSEAVRLDALMAELREATTEGDSG